MKIGIIGGNGNVGIALANRLKEFDGFSVVPIVRGPLSAGPLNEAGLPYRIADVTDQNEAAEALSDLDVAIISARKSVGLETVKKDLEYNLDIVRNACEYTSDRCTIIYFSSISAYGKELADSIKNEFNSYVKEKRRGEKIIRETLPETGYALRLGHVFGDNQSWTQTLTKHLVGSNRLIVRADPQRKSNVLHIPTLVETLQKCIENKITPGRFTVLNSPQWTWREVIEYYAETGTEITFETNDSGSSQIGSRIQSHALEFLGSFQDLSLYTPRRLKSPLVQKYHIQEVQSQIASYERRRTTTVALPIFDRNGLSESTVPNLTPTQKLLKQE